MRHIAIKPILSASIELYPFSKQFKDDWDRLYNDQDVHSPFSTLNWIESGIEEYIDDTNTIYPIRFVDAKGIARAITILRLVVFSDSKSSRIWPIKELRTIDFNSQRTTPILAEDLCYFSEAINSILSLKTIHFDKLVLYKVEYPTDSQFKELIFSLNNLSYLSVSVYNIQPRFIFSGDWCSYLMDRTQGHRKKIRRYPKKLQEAYPDYQFTRLRTPDDFVSYGVDRCFDEMSSLFMNSWQALELKKKGKGLDLAYCNFYKKIFLKFFPLGCIDLGWIHANGELLAFDMGLHIEGHIYLVFCAYSLEYQDYSPGTANLVEMLRTGFMAHDKVLEFGGGYLEYKRLWTNDEMNSYKIAMATKTMRGRLSGIIMRLKDKKKHRM
jgi:hypothetical protein